MSDSQKNKELVHRYIHEVWNNGKLEVIDDLISPDYVVSDASGAGGKGPDSVRQFASQLRKAVPDLRYTVEDIVSEGDLVVVRLASAGSSRHASSGSPQSKHNRPPKGVLGFKVKDNKIVSGWQHWDHQPTAEMLS